jgi:hypothetical protein
MILLLLAQMIFVPIPPSEHIYDCQVEMNAVLKYVRTHPETPKIVKEDLVETSYRLQGLYDWFNLQEDKK